MDRNDLIKVLMAEKLLKSRRVIRAFEEVPREDFIPGAFKGLAYSDTPLPIPGSQTISAPHMVAVMSEYLDVRGGQKVLEIGAGSGYQAAILSKMVLKGKVYTVEVVPELTEFAKKT